METILIFITLFNGVMIYINYKNKRYFNSIISAFACGLSTFAFLTEILK